MCDLMKIPENVFFLIEVLKNWLLCVAYCCRLLKIHHMKYFKYFEKPVLENRNHFSELKHLFGIFTFCLQA